MRHHSLFCCGLAVVASMFLLSAREAQAQAAAIVPMPPPPGPLPPRQPIFLNNNASLYTFQNPNFGMPGQLPYAFVAVAHEDCRLYNNGALLMPRHRLLAAECLQAGQNGQNGIMPIVPLPLPPATPRPPIYNPYNPYYGGQPNFGGVNYNRAMAYTSAPLSSAVAQTSAGAGATSPAPTRSYQGFGSFREKNSAGFGATVSFEAASFGSGFDRKTEEKSQKEQK